MKSNSFVPLLNILHKNLKQSPKLLLTPSSPFDIKSVCNFQSVKSPMELNSLFVKIILLYHLV